MLPQLVPRRPFFLSGRRRKKRAWYNYSDCTCTSSTWEQRIVILQLTPLAMFSVSTCEVYDYARSAVFDHFHRSPGLAGSNRMSYQRCQPKNFNSVQIQICTYLKMSETRCTNVFVSSERNATKLVIQLGHEYVIQKHEGNIEYDPLHFL